MANVTNEMILQAVKELSAQLINHKDETNQRFEHIDKRFEQIDQRFERLEKEIGQIKEQLTDLATGQKILVEELFNNKTEIKRIKNVLNIY